MLTKKPAHPLGTFSELQVIERGIYRKLFLPKYLFGLFIEQYGDEFRLANPKHSLFAQVDEYGLANSEKTCINLSVPEKEEKHLEAFLKRFGKENEVEYKNISNEHQP
jgi:hypothetical protein